MIGAGREVRFEVFGEPIPQGSKTRTTFGMREDNKRTKPWREQVAQVAGHAMRFHDILAGPVGLTATFLFARPASQYGTGRNPSRLKPSEPIYRASKPDTDKLVLAIGDAVSGIVVRDDAQIVHV